MGCRASDSNAGVNAPIAAAFESATVSGDCLDISSGSPDDFANAIIAGVGDEDIPRVIEEDAKRRV
jgi:hypothetical protein